MGHHASIGERTHWDGKVYAAAHFNEGSKLGTVDWAHAEQARLHEEQRLERKLEQFRKWTSEALKEAVDRCHNLK